MAESEVDLADFFDWEDFEKSVDSTEDAEVVSPVCECKIPSTESLTKCNNEQCTIQWFHSTCAIGKPLSQCDEETLRNWTCTMCSGNVFDTSGADSQQTGENVHGKDSGSHKTESTVSQKPGKMKYPTTTYKKADATVVAPDFLAAAVEDVFESELFSLDIPLSRAVKELAGNVRTLLGTAIFDDFAHKTVDALWKLLKTIRGSAWTDKLKGSMWHQFHLYRSAKETLERWQRTLSDLKIERQAEEEVFLLQHILHNIFSSLLATLLETDMPAEILDVCPQVMDENEEQALRYCAGYVPFKLKKKYSKIKGNDVAAQQYIDVLTSWCEIQSDDAESLFDYTTKWINVQSRGGLFKINDNVFLLFKMMEEIVRATVQVKNINCLQDVNLQSLLLKKMEGDQKLMSRWNSVCTNLASEGSSKLRTEVFKCYTKMRCESFIKVYLHIRKQK